MDSTISGPRCSVDDCMRPMNKRGYCGMHYQRVLKRGTPGGPGPERNPGRGCAVPGCGQPHVAHGYCGPHNHRYVRTGDPLGSQRMSLGERLDASTDKSGECWIWTGVRNKSGYGRIYVHDKGRPMLAHRVAYELRRGPIPDALVIDHLCRTPACINPAHMEVVTNDENFRRGLGNKYRNGMADTCKHGHPMSGDNVYVRPGGSYECRECKRAQMRRFYARKRAA